MGFIASRENSVYKMNKEIFESWNSNRGRSVKLPNGEGSQGRVAYCDLVRQPFIRKLKLIVLYKTIIIHL
jgi:hypothetical protein